MASHSCTHSDSHTPSEPTPRSRSIRRPPRGSSSTRNTWRNQAGSRCSTRPRWSTATRSSFAGIATTAPAPACNLPGPSSPTIPSQEFEMPCRLLLQVRPFRLEARDFAVGAVGPGPTPPPWSTHTRSSSSPTTLTFRAVVADVEVAVRVVLLRRLIAAPERGEWHHRLTVPERYVSHEHREPDVAGGNPQRGVSVRVLAVIHRDVLVEVQREAVEREHHQVPPRRSAGPGSRGRGGRCCCRCCSLPSTVAGVTRYGGYRPFHQVVGGVRAQRLVEPALEVGVDADGAVVVQDATSSM